MVKFYFCTLGEFSLTDEQNIMFNEWFRH